MSRTCTRLLGVLLLAATALCGFGCAHGGLAPDEGATIAPAQLGIPSELGPTAFRILQTTSSQGRFPGALAVARVQPAESEGQAVSWHVTTLKTEKASYWNTLFNSTPEVRETLMLDEGAFAALPCGTDAIVVAARRHGATICLLYGAAATDAGRSARIGAIYDVSTGSVVAGVHADAGPEDIQPPRTDRPHGDKSNEDVGYLADRKFERQVHTCVLQLIRRDTRVPETEPSPWLNPTTRPAMPVIVVPPGALR